jgi:hypothetical protein
MVAKPGLSSPKPVHAAPFRAACALAVWVVQPTAALPQTATVSFLETVHVALVNPALWTRKINV